jgi:hypothetical protein
MASPRAPRRWLALASLCLASAAVLAACASVSEGSDPVQAGLQTQALRAAGGVSKVRHALDHPELASRELGEGVMAVEAATRELGLLEDDARASDLQRLMAMVHQARAWDDVSQAFQRAIAAAPATTTEGEDPAHQALATVLSDKAFPARVAAENGYRRALRSACRFGFDELPVVQEITDGIARYGEAPPADHPCARQ